MDNQKNICLFSCVFHWGVAFVDRKKPSTVKCANTAASSSRLQSRESEGEDKRGLGNKGKQRRKSEVSTHYFWIIFKKPKQKRTHSLLLEDSDGLNILKRIEDKEFLKRLQDFLA